MNHKWQEFGSDTMGKINGKRRVEGYYKIYEQIYHHPQAAIFDIAEEITFSRNTVSKYLLEMIKKNILLPPFLGLKPAQNYTEYVSFLNFDNPDFVFTQLKELPHILYSAFCALSWNVLTVSTKPFDFSQLHHFQSLLFQGERGIIVTPRCGMNGTARLDMDTVNLDTLKKIKLPKQKKLPWDETQWKLFDLFKYNLRKKVTPTIRKGKVRYEDYMKWREPLKEHCTIHTLFYPRGLFSYRHWLFLIKTDYDISSLFQGWHASCIFTTVKDYVLALIPVMGRTHQRELLASFQELQDQLGIEQCYRSILLDHVY